MRILNVFGALALVAGALPLAAQGSVGSQGLGYPLGGLSGAASALAGANAELDPNTALNPAAIARSNRLSISLRFEPEFRETTAGASRAYSKVLRFPGLQFTGAYGRFVGAAGMSPMLDRSWRNQRSDTLVIGGTPTPSVLQVSSDGALNEARVALGYIVSPELQFGAALHAVTGESRTFFARRFADTSGVQGVSQQNSFGYGGTAFSFGVVAEPMQNLVISASAKVGGRLTMELEGKELAAANVPSRVGVGIAYFGIAGISAHLRADRVQWSDLSALSDSAGPARDATELAAGVEALGPKLFGTATLLRIGLRERDLPFDVRGNAVRERGLGFGVGLPVGRSRAQLDLGAQRMQRTTAGASENAWLVTIGLGIRP